MDAKSVMLHKVKVASLTQEGVQRLCNMSRDLEDTPRCDVLSSYMQKLRLSGYSQALRAYILESAVLTYRNKERAELLGVQPIHRKGVQGQETRRRANITGRTSWYQPSTSGWKSRLKAKEQELLEQQRSQDTSTPTSTSTTITTTNTTNTSSRTRYCHLSSRNTPAPPASNTACHSRSPPPPLLPAQSLHAVGLKELCLSPTP